MSMPIGRFVIKLKTMKTKIRILHVDDSIHDRILVRDVLEKEYSEYEIISADNRDKFEKYLSEKEFDLVLSDFNILGFDGLQVLGVVKKVKPDLPVIIVTGTGSEEIAIQAMKMGAADYVIKSVKHIQGLSPTIKSVLEHNALIKEHKEAQERCKENEERFRSIFENSTLGIYRTSPDGKILLANPTLVLMLGYDNFDDLASINIELQGYETKHQRDEFIKHIEEEGFIKGFESTWKKKDNSIIYVRESAKAFYNKEGTILYYEGIIEDITERKHAQDALQKNEQQFKALTEEAPVGIFKTDANGNTTYVNPRWCEISGIGLNEAKGNGWINAVHPDDRGIITEGWQKAVEKSESSLAEYRFLRPDGTISWVSGKAVAQVDDKGNLIGYIGTSTDITERKHVEDALKESEEKFKSYIQHSPLGVFIANEKGEFLEVNPAASIITGSGIDELLTMSIPNLFIEDALPVALQHFERVKNEGEAIAEIPYIRKNGSKNHWIVSAVKLSDKRFLGFVIDITDLKNAKEEIIKLNTELEKKIEERTSELKQKIDELERMNNLFVGRELRIKELRDKIKELENIVNTRNKN
ncbi:MAG TPA: hypothetical protein DCQ24_12410 [Bacteroidales bacterium]|nr:hypothetical protein [Bacteroidales bacterium]